MINIENTKDTIKVNLEKVQVENNGANLLGTEKISKLIFNLAVPAVAAQLINVLYNIVDRIYIGRIEGYGALALTGVGITFPIISLIAAFSGLAGTGAAPIASRKLGENDVEGAKKILGTSTAMLLLFSLILTLFFSVFKEPLLYMFGASDQTITYASDYIGIYLLGTVFVQLSLGLNPFISGQGKAKIAMLSVCLGAGVNIILDPILIFGFNMGVKGAATATIISQICSAIWIVRFLTSHKSVIKLEKKNIKCNKVFMAQIAALGISPFIMSSTESVVTVTLNSGLQKYGGDLYVGSMSILLSIMQLITVPMNGMAYGIQPIISYNYGARNFTRVIETFKRMLVICFLGTAITSGIVISFPHFFVGLFTENNELLELTASVVPIFFVGIVIFGIQLACQSTFLALGEAKVSLFIALLRKVLLLTPLAIILPKYFGVMGIYYAEPIADIISVCTAIILFIVTIRKLMKKLNYTK